MKKGKIIAVIPARYESSRFVGKPLADICGKPMVWHVYQNAKKDKRIEKVLIAIDDSRVEIVCRQLKLPYIMTSKKHQNGTERVSEVAEMTDADIYITVQGDEPLLEEKTISSVLDLILTDESIKCATLKTKYKNPIDVINSTTPKVVTDLSSNVLLFTRSPIPYPKASLNYCIYKPLGVYAFRRDILLRYRELEKGPLEGAEDIELLRLIENGIPVRIAETDSVTIAVDTPKDLERVREIYVGRVNKEF